MSGRKVLLGLGVALGLAPAASADDLERMLGLGLQLMIQSQRQGAAPASPQPQAATPTVPSVSTTRQGLPRSESVLQAQRQLNALGYDAGSPDGQAGARTRAAVSRWQADQGLPETGVLSDVELAALLAGPGPAAGSPPVEVLPIAEMVAIQRSLQSLGYDPGPADGVAGRRTGEEVSRFLIERGLDPYQTPIRQAQALILAEANGVAVDPQPPGMEGEVSPAVTTQVDAQGLNLPPGLAAGRDTASGAAMAGDAVILSEDSWIFGHPMDDLNSLDEQRAGLTNLVLLYALKGHPALLEDPTTTLEFVRVLPRDVVEPYVNFGQFAGSARWKGATQFAVEDSRQAFLSAFRDDLLALASSAPMALLDVSMMELGRYDATTGLLAVEAQPVPGRWWTAQGAPIRFEVSADATLPKEWPLPAEDARRVVEAAAAGYLRDGSVRAGSGFDFGASAPEGTTPIRAVVLTRIEVRGLRPVEHGILLELAATEAVVYDSLSGWTELGRLPLDGGEVAVVAGPPILDPLWPRLWRVSKDSTLLDDPAFVAETFAIRRSQEAELVGRSDAQPTTFPLVIAPALLGSRLEPAAEDLERLRDWMATQSQGLPERVTIRNLRIAGSDGATEFRPIDAIRLASAPPPGSSWQDAPLAAAGQIRPDSLGFAAMGSGLFATTVVSFHPDPAWYGIALPFSPSQDLGDLELDLLSATLETDDQGAPFVLLDVVPASLAWRRLDESGWITETGTVDVELTTVSETVSDPTWEVAGVRLGMPLAEAEAAAVAFMGGGEVRRFAEEEEDPVMGHHVQLAAEAVRESVVIFYDPGAEGAPVTAVGRSVLDVPEFPTLEEGIATVLPSLEAKYGPVSGTDPTAEWIVYWAVDPVVSVRLTDGLERNDPCALRNDLRSFTELGTVRFETPADGPDCGPMMAVSVEPGQIRQFMTDTGLFGPIHARVAAGSPPAALAIEF